MKETGPHPDSGTSITGTACNRQATRRVHVYTDKKQIADILEVQGGVRGYATPPRLLAITSDLRCWFGGHERNQGYVDAGLYAMELLLALEDQNLAACALNTMAFYKKSRKLRTACGIPDNEIFAMLIAVGPPPTGKLTPISFRQSGESITSWH